ncbi:MAG: hypothetical protein DMG60_05175 [Acidobacteria bacterium]|nr:MAG: hypothetical protein DMG60_05175 [Acidobacteriota bacterium]
MPGRHSSIHKSINKDYCRDFLLRPSPAVEFRPQSANFTPRQGPNRDLRRFPPKLNILLGLVLFLRDIAKKIRDLAGIFRSIMELASSTDLPSPKN